MNTGSIEIKMKMKFAAAAKENIFCNSILMKESLTL